MTYLLDVNALVALLNKGHIHHQQAQSWAIGKKLALCPISELGYLRVSKNAHQIGVMDGRAQLEKWTQALDPLFIPADIHAWKGAKVTKASETTDYYLSELAQAHGCRLGTFDEGIKHPAVDLISKNLPAQSGAAEGVGGQE